MGRRSRSRSPKRRRSRSRDRERRRSRSRDRDRRRSRDRSPRRPHFKKEEIKKEIKTEEEFDRRQDQARDRRQNRDRDQDVKQERRSPQAGSSNPFAEELRQTNDWGKAGEGGGKKEVKEKEKVNLGLSGALTADQNTYKGVVIKYAEPPEAKIPKKKWRFYPFKGEELLKIIYLHRQSAYLIGRLAHVCEIPVDHPSCSKQHAALQFRAVKVKKSSGRDVLSVKPYIIDLESSNGTFLNNQKLEPKRYYELRERDVVKFGFSTREYVLLHEKSDTNEVHESSSEDEESEED